MVLNHVETSRRRRQPGDPVHPDHPAPPRWQGQGVEEPTRAAVFRLGALARLARAHVLGDIDVLTHPESEAAYQRPRLGPPEVSPERAVVALAEHLCAQPSAGGDAEAVRLTLPAAVQQAATHQERPALRCAGGSNDGRAKSIHEPAERRRRAAHDGPENLVDGQPRH